MKKYTPVEWQAFSQKKDVEKISESLKSQNGFQLSAFVEVALVVMGAALSNIITDDNLQLKIWMFILIISCLVILAPFASLIYKKIKQMRKGNNLLSTKEAIDCFDNEICYYVMMSDSYYTMYKERKKELEGNPDGEDTGKDDILEFYYIETSYYLNKAIMCLQPIYNMSSKVLSKKKSEIVARRLISYTRFENVCNIIVKIYAQLMNETIKIDSLVKNVNQKYYSIFEDILKMINNKG